MTFFSASSPSFLSFALKFIDATRLFVVSKAIKFKRTTNEPDLLAEFSKLLAANKNTSEILRYLHSKKNILNPINSAVHFLSQIYIFTQKIEDNLPVFPTSDKKNYIIHVCTWGESYTDKLIKYFLPSLLAPGNIPAVSKEVNVILWLHCDNQSCNKIINSTVMRELENFATFRFDLIPDNILILMKKLSLQRQKGILGIFASSHLDWKYYLLGCLQNNAMLSAKLNKSSISFLMPDNLMSDNALSYMFQSLGDEKFVVASSAFRTSAEKIKVDEFYQENALCLCANHMTNIVVSNMHKSVYTRIVSNNNKYFSVSPQLIFSYHDQIIVRSLHWHPILVDFSRLKKDMFSNYLPIDSSFIENSLNNSVPFDDQIYINNDHGYIGIMEISDDDMIGTNTSTERKSEINVEQIISEYVNRASWGSINRKLLNTRFKYKIQGQNNNPLSDVNDLELIPIYVD